MTINFKYNIQSVRQKTHRKINIIYYNKNLSNPNLGDFSDLLREIMAEVRKLTNAERCSLFLLDPDQQDLVAKVFDGISTGEVGNLHS